ncbi:MAG: ABC transporter ATP-binding protein [Candidatus Aenigmatarchaeota archaeon]
MLKVSSVIAGYGEIQVLWDVSLYVSKGEIVSLIGSNGAGKSTLLAVISGLIKPRKGSIIFEGMNINDLTPEAIVRMGISHVPQGRRLFAGLTVRENLMMGAYLRKNRREIQQDLDFVYTLFPRLKEREKQLAGKLSGGEQQMCAIGRALMSSPKLLLIDELSLGLAPVVVDSLIKVLHQINQKGTTILLVEQDVQIALENSTRAYVMETGRITMEGTARDLLTNEHIRKAYLGL